MTDRAGQQLGNYRLLRLLGKGGFAEVYLGEHIYLKTPAAIKLLQTKVANQEDLDGFLKEAQTIARLVHPQIVRVLDFGVDSETPFLVMDYAPNGTLRQRHPRGTQLPLTTIVPYVKQVADALQHAHDEKLIHRDIKPENMLLGRRNEVLLSDFGIALIAQSSRYQSTQDVIGTVAYMSPEQIQGKPRPASDQYSLAIVVYEWLSGDRPFHGSFTELCTQHMFASPPPLREKLPTVLPDVEQVVTMALAKDPKQRFGSVQAFANALEQASQPQQPTFVTPSRPPALQPDSRPLSPPTPQRPVAPTPLPPTQMATPPSLPPTQAATPLRETSLSSNASYSASANYPAASKPIARVPDEKVNAWGIGKRQLVAMIVGLAVYGILGYVLDQVFNHSDSSSFLLQPLFPFNNAQISYFTPGSILIGLLFAIALFFGVEAGPWVGLVVMGAGGLLSDYLSNYISIYHVNWYWYVAGALCGFISGLAFPITRGRFASGGAIAIAVAMSGVGLVIYSALGVFGDGISSQVSPTDFFTLLLPALLSLILANAIGLVFLPIVLLTYNTIVSRRK